MKKAAYIVKTSKVINNVLILENEQFEFVPWQIYIDDNIVGCIYPSNKEGGWYLELASGIGIKKFEKRGIFKFDEYAKSLITFIHPSEFMCFTDSKEHAIKLTEYIQPVDWKSISE